MFIALVQIDRQLCLQPIRLFFPSIFAALVGRSVGPTFPFYQTTQAAVPKVGDGWERARSERQLARLWITDGGDIPLETPCYLKDFYTAVMQNLD